MTQATQGTNISFGISRKSLEAVKIHACPCCRAPGVFKNDQRTRTFWPGCWREKARNEPVGDICPNCGAPRTANKNLGELTASMPLWIWKCILGVKWCVIKLVALRQRAGART
jgi:hypothetical protein